LTNEKQRVNIKLQDVMHTFKKGHKIKSRFRVPGFFDRLESANFVDIIYAKPEDFKKANASRMPTLK
jgi:hypothetical protein